MARRYTETQGQYLAFIYNYTVLFGQAPSESDMQRFFGKTPPTIHQMVVKLADLQLINRKPGEARSIEILIDPDEIPRLLPSSTEEL
jgi:repressor LexA